MTTEKEKIQGIVKELVANALDADATDIDVNVKITKEKTVITVKDNGSGMNEKSAERVRRVLHQQRRDEIENYYGILAGNSMTAAGLNLVGMLVDDAIVESRPNEGSTITVIRFNK